MADKYLTHAGLSYFWGKLKTLFAGKVDIVAGKGLSTNDYTTTEKNKLSGIENGAQVNKIDVVKVNNVDVPISGKSVNINLTSYALKTDITAILKYKGTKATVGELPVSDNEVGDVWFVTEKSSEYAWQGDKWEMLGATIDLTPYLTKTDAASTYLAKTDATSTYLTKTEAGTTYLKITDADGRYVTSTGLEEALAELLTTIGDTYLSKSDASGTYAKKADITAIANSEIDTIMNS